jgi:cellulase/cellobiase CelA1
MKVNVLFASLLTAALTLSSCGGLGGLATGTSSTTSSSTSTSSSQSASDLGSIIGGILGSFTKSTTEKTILGTWVYAQPSFQLESDNVLSQMGGSVASSTIISKLEPYYQQLGITAGAMTITLNSDKTCSYTLKGKSYTGTYTFNESAGTIQIKGQLLSFPSGYISVSGNQMSLTMDATKALSLLETMGSASSGTSLGQIASIAKSYDGMKVGFQFKKQ